MSVTIMNLDGLRRKLAQLNPAEKKAVGVAIKTAALNVQNGAKSRVLVDRGTLRNKITHEMEAENLNATVGVMGGKKGARTSTVKQAQAIEFGRRPGQKPPPVMAIMDWVKRKRISGTYSVKTHKRTGSMASRVHEDYFVALMISRKIGKHGTPAHPFLFPAFEQERPKIIPRIAAALTAAHREVASK